MILSPITTPLLFHLCQSPPFNGSFRHHLALGIHCRRARGEATSFFPRARKHVRFSTFSFSHNYLYFSFFLSLFFLCQRRQPALREAELTKKASIFFQRPVEQVAPGQGFRFSLVVGSFFFFFCTDVLGVLDSLIPSPLPF